MSFDSLIAARAGATDLAARADSGSALAAPVTFRGESGALVPDATSMLRAAQEEMGFARTGTRSLESRRVRPDIGSRDIDVRLANVYLDSRGGEDILEGGTAERFLARLRERDGRKGGREETARELRARIRTVSEETCPDTAHDRFALLVHARERLRANGGGEEALAAAVDDAIDAFSRESGQVVRAGFNADNRARVHAVLGGRSVLTELYVEHVVGSTGVSRVYEALTERYGRERFDQAVGFLIGAAGDDMASIGPSTDRSALRSAMDTLHRVQTLVSMEKGCAVALARLGRWVRAGVDHHVLLGALLALHEEKFPLAAAVHGRCRRIVRDTPQASVAFHNQFCELVEQIPLRAFDDERGKRTLVDVVREARDEAVSREEREKSSPDDSRTGAESRVAVPPAAVPS